MLTGVKSVTLLDDAPATLNDLSANFYLTEKDIGKPRASACANKLAELNSYVQIKVITGELTPEVLAKFQVNQISTFQILTFRSSS
jgi:ubiquitin-activating enzyme E1